MNRLLTNFVTSFFLFLSVMISSAGAVDSIEQKKDKASDTGGSIVLREILIAHQMLSNTKQSDRDKSTIPGSIVLLSNGRKYEVVSFKFENTTDDVLEETFEEYVKINNLLYMRSVVSGSSEGKDMLEIFDSSRANLDDGVLFNITLRPLDENEY